MKRDSSERTYLLVELESREDVGSSSVREGGSVERVDHLHVRSERSDSEISNLELGESLGNEGESLVGEMNGVGFGL